MQHTNQYQFNLIESADTFSAAPLNENAEKMEGTLAQIQSALAKAGNCKISTGTYTGTGAYGSSANSTKLTLDCNPLLLFIVGGNYTAFALNGGKMISIGNGSDLKEQNATWSEKTVSWYTTASVGFQMNTKDTVYTYFAIAT